MAQKIKVQFTWADKIGGPRKEVVEMEYYYFCNTFCNGPCREQEQLRNYIRTHFYGDPSESYFCRADSIGGSWWE